MEALLAQTDLPPDGFDASVGRSLPEPFADLQVMKILPQEARIVVENCPHYFVNMEFLGMDPGTKNHPEKLIVVRWGDSEGLGEEVLWREQ